MTNSSDVVAAVGEGHETCPGCGGDEWKGARMVVLEGTTFSKGEISGEITDPGGFSGGLRAFLVSDRWFSWKNELEGDVEFSTTSGLALAVKKLMVQYASLVQAPPEPSRPDNPSPPKAPKIGFFERIRPLEPSRPEEPELPTAPIDRPWYWYFWRSLQGDIALALIGVAGFYFFYARNNVVPEWAWSAVGGLFLLLVLGSLFKSFKANQEARSEHDEKQARLLEKHQRACKEFEANYAVYLSDCKRASVQQEDHKRATVKHERRMADYERQVAEIARVHSQQLAEFEEAKRNVLLVRELLWERARVCLRCGNAYFGRA